MISKWMRAGLAALALMSAPAWAQEDPATGLWRTVDDQTGKPKALIRISESGETLSGKVEKLFRTPDQEPNPVCDKCENGRRDQPVLGMTILTGMKKGEGREYSGGEMLDPANGKIYKSRMTLSEDGKKLEVRGYIGMPMLGRTQVWERVK